MNDFVISSVDTGIGKRHMVIKYSMDNKSYYLRDLGDGSGTFVKIDVPLVSFPTLFSKFYIVIETWVHNIVWRFSYGCLILLRWKIR